MNLKLAKLFTHFVNKGKFLPGKITSLERDIILAFEEVCKPKSEAEGARLLGIERTRWFRIKNNDWPLSFEEFFRIVHAIEKRSDYLKDRFKYKDVLGDL